MPKQRRNKKKATVSFDTQASRDKFDEKYYAQNTEMLKDTGWKRISTEAARYLFQNQNGQILVQIPSL